MDNYLKKFDLYPYYNDWVYQIFNMFNSDNIKEYIIIISKNMI